MRLLKIILFLTLIFSFADWLALAQSPGELSLRRVTLYRHGVGYFERQGKVNGDRRLSFSFDETQIKDVMMSYGEYSIFGLGPSEVTLLGDRE